MARDRSKPADWPELDWPAWRETCAAFHLRAQVVGKIRLARAPWTNHGWHVPLYVSARGLTTSPIPHGARTFEIELDLIEHAVEVRVSDSGRRTLSLAPGSIAAFHRDLTGALDALGVGVRIRTMPSEIADAIPFDRDTAPRPWDAPAATRFWQALVQVDRVFKEFRARFVGKCSPVHFFWGSFDLAVTRFSGREAPPHPGGIPNFPDWVAREAYSHEVSSAGFWPGGGGVEEAAFYAYAYPEPPGFRAAAARPDAATFHEGLGEFVLPYDAVRRAPSPDDALLDFLQSTYEAAAAGAGWDRAALERRLPPAADRR